MEKEVDKEAQTEVVEVEIVMAIVVQTESVEVDIEEAKEVSL